MSKIFHRINRPCLGRRAISALEFAMVAPLLVTMMLMILEAGLVLFGQATLDYAAADAARLIRTGQVQGATAPQTLFTSRLCNDLSLLVACPKVQINVQSAASFGALNTAVTVDGTGAMTPTGFAPGAAGQYVLVQVGYQPDESLPLIGAVIRAAFGPIIVSSVAFQNEAF